jgi:hypothetical protein
LKLMLLSPAETAQTEAPAPSSTAKAKEEEMTVIDPKTGLMWQRGETGEMNWERAKSYCQNLSLAGYTDWQLPDQEALQQMFAYSDGGHYSKVELRRMFPDIYPSGYWSSTTYVSYASHAWGVYFHSGHVSYYSKSVSHYMRCVRASTAKEEGRLTVIDPKTGLMWQRGEPGGMNWERAKSYCQNLSLAGYTDWQLSDKETLQQMFAYKRGGYYSETELRRMFPDINSSVYWSSTTNVNHSSYAWLVSFSNGGVYFNSKNRNGYVRCVRGSK